MDAVKHNHKLEEQPTQFLQETVQETVQETAQETAQDGTTVQKVQEVTNVLSQGHGCSNVIQGNSGTFSNFCHTCCLEETVRQKRVCIPRQEMLKYTVEWDGAE